MSIRCVNCGEVIIEAGEAFCETCKQRHEEFKHKVHASRETKEQKDAK